MPSSLRTRLLSPKTMTLASSPDVVIPDYFRCPISLELMKDPVTVPTGITYDRPNIETWLDIGNNTCPLTNLPVHHEQLLPNHTLRRVIQAWCVAHASHGVERIPTPRVPATRAHIETILARIDFSEDSVFVSRAVGEVKEIAKEGERNRKRVRDCDAASTLARCFRRFARAEKEPHTWELLEEILSGLVLFQMELEARREMVREESVVDSLVWILDNGSLTGRLDAITVVAQLSGSLTGSFSDPITKSNRLIHALARLLKEPISNRSTKSALVSAFGMASARPNVASKFAETGLVGPVVELLVDADRSTCEMALGVLDQMCGCEVGRRAALDHDLTVAVVVKKLVRVSGVATEFAVSALRKLLVCVGGENNNNKRRLEEEALAVGAFQKLLMLLQMGVVGKTKENVKEVLKVLNSARGNFGGLHCVESGDFKGLKRPF